MSGTGSVSSAVAKGHDRDWLLAPVIAFAAVQAFMIVQRAALDGTFIKSPPCETLFGLIGFLVALCVGVATIVLAEIFEWKPRRGSTFFFRYVQAPLLAGFFLGWLPVQAGWSSLMHEFAAYPVKETLTVDWVTERRDKHGRVFHKAILRELAGFGTDSVDVSPGEAALLSRGGTLVVTGTRSWFGLEVETVTVPGFDPPAAPAIPTR
jgi:hypothetical protein